MKEMDVYQKAPVRDVYVGVPGKLCKL
jgi:hypothetical protein